MLKEELVQKSALRLLEQASHGGLQRGEIGVFVSRHGVGKTACLVHIAIDRLLQNKSVIHVSFSDRTDHIMEWYENSFKTLAQEKHLEAVMQVHDEIVHNRVVMHFAQRTIQADRVIATLTAMISEGHFPADLIIFDGYDFSAGNTGFIQKVKDFVTAQGVSAWFSASTHREAQADNQGFPHLLADFEPWFDIVLSLRPESEHILLSLIKDRNYDNSVLLPLELDSRTLLIRKSG